MGTKAKLLKVFIPLLILALGFGIMVVLIKIKPAPRKEESQTPGVLVKTETVSATDWTVTVRSTGTTEAAMEISVIPQVNGTVVWMDKNFKVGRFFQKGELLFRIDDTDYRLELQKAKAVLAQAEYELEKIKSQAGIARQEWEIMSEGGDTDAPSPLVLYKPQLKNAEASLQSAKASEELARLNLKRTEIHAPFDCRVSSKSVDLGQYVRSGTQVATVSSTSSAEAVVLLRQDHLHWIDIPTSGNGKAGSKATVIAHINGEDVSWDGSVVRMTGEVDPKSRTVKVIVAVEDPYGLKSKRDKKLLNGSFVTVAIEGSRLNDVYVLPKSALKDDSTVWIMDENNKLRIRDVHVARTEREKVIMDQGLQDGEKVVLTRISGAADGMKLRDAGESLQ